MQEDCEGIELWRIPLNWVPKVQALSETLRQKDKAVYLKLLIYTDCSFCVGNLFFFCGGTHKVYIKTNMILNEI